MRTQVIPAQITTVEDKIAGNLNGTQLFLLMIPILYTTLDYAIFYPHMHVSVIKILSALFVLIASILLSLRIKGKVVFNWLIVILAYNIRPKYYVCNKNDTYLRQLDLLTPEKHSHTHISNAHAVKKEPQEVAEYGVKELLQLEKLIGDTKRGLTFRWNRKGGLHVAFNEIK